MGSCISKKTPCSTSTINIPETQQDELKTATRKLNDNVTAQVEKELVEKRKSVKKEVFVIHHMNPGEDGDSCTKEEVRRRRRMSFGSNTSFDFDAENVVVGEGEEGRLRLSRSGSRRRVSKSPVRRSQSPVILSGSGIESGVPGKMVAVPATVTSLSIDRVLVQRNVGSPRSQSPAKASGDVSGRFQSPVKANGNVRNVSGRFQCPVTLNGNVNGRSESRVRGNQVSGNVNGRCESPIENRAIGGGSGNVNRRSQSPIKKNRAIGGGNVNGNERSQSPIEKNRAIGGGTENVNGRSQSPIEKNRAGGRGYVNGRSHSPNGGESGNVNGRSQTVVIGNQVNESGHGNGRFESPLRGNPTSGNGNGNGNGNEGGWQQHILSRNGSRKSPYRRTPLNEIDLNSLPFQPLSNKRPLNKGKEIQDDGLMLKQAVNFVSPNKYAADTVSIKSAAHGTHRRTRSRGTEGYEITKTNYCRVDNLHKLNPDKMTGNFDKHELNASEYDYDAMVTPVILSGNDTHKLPQTLVRSKSARRSRDFDINVDDASLKPTPATNYTSLLLQDIQKFHQNKNSNSNSLPPCVNKACSIVEAVADLNSTTRKNPSFTFTDDLKIVDQYDHPFVESEVEVEESIHKYVTVRKKSGEEIDDVESYGRNSITGKSTELWMSKSNTPENEVSPVGFQRHAKSDRPSGTVNKSEVKCSSKGREQIRTVRSRTRPVITSK